MSVELQVLNARLDAHDRWQEQQNGTMLEIRNNCVANRQDRMKDRQEQVEERRILQVKVDKLLYLFIAQILATLFVRFL